MAKCEYCNQEMTVANTCGVVPIINNKIKFKPIKFGNELTMFLATSDGRCPDCNVKIGGYHHPGCDREECPICHLQAISCGCEDE